MSKPIRHRLTISFTEEVKDTLEQLALEKQASSTNSVYKSDIVRDALQEYFDNRGIDVSVTVNRGGHRWRKNKPD